MNLEGCYRCKNKEAVFSCLNCESFKLLCTQCDSYVHGLPSKSKHRRTTLFEGKCNDQSTYKSQQKQMNTTGIKNPNILINDNHKENTIDWDSRFNFSQVNKNEEFEDKPNKVNQNTNANFFNSEVNDTKCINDYNNLNTLNMNTLNTNTLTNIYKNTSFNNYSREYMNEIKSIFEKEKNELIYKYTSLQNNLDRLKVNFSEQISTHNSDINDLTLKHQINLKNVSNNYEAQINSILEEKNSQISQLQHQVAELSDINNELTQKIEVNLKSINEMRENTTAQLTNIDSIVLKKDEEIKKLTEHYERKINDLERLNEEDKNRIVYDYENKIENMINQFENARETMTKMLQDRENDIRNIIEKNKLEVQFYVKENLDSKHEIECHKTNILAIRNKRNVFEEEIHQLKEYIEKLKKESKFQLSEIKLLDNQNKALNKENDELKIQIAKLDKLVYGKIRSNYKN